MKVNIVSAREWVNEKTIPKDWIFRQVISAWKQVECIWNVQLRTERFQRPKLNRILAQFVPENQTDIYGNPCEFQSRDVTNLEHMCKPREVHWNTHRHVARLPFYVKSAAHFERTDILSEFQ